MNQNYFNGHTRSQRAYCYSPENETAFKGQQVPGPGQYDSHFSTKTRDGNANQYSIAKADRKLNDSLEPKEVAGSHSPGRKLYYVSQRSKEISHQDCRNQIKVTKKRGAKAVIGTSKNRFDVTKMQSINQNMWKKGLIYY